jgi:hypothetical protein
MTSSVCSDGNCYRPRRLHKNRTRYNPGITTNSHGKMYATAVIA